MRTHVLSAPFQTLPERRRQVLQCLELSFRASGEQFLGETNIIALQAVRIHTDIIVQRYRIFVLCRVSKRPGLKQHFAAVVGIRSNLELAAVGVEGEHVEPHWAEEGDVGGLAVQHILFCTYPHTFKSV